MKFFRKRVNDENDEDNGDEFYFMLHFFNQECKANTGYEWDGQHNDQFIKEMKKGKAINNLTGYEEIENGNAKNVW